MNFLDITIEVCNGKLKSTLYRKPTAGTSILFGTSCHPTNLKWSIPVGELLRAKRNYSESADYQRVKSDMQCCLGEMGYPKKVLEGAMERVAKEQRTSLLGDRHKTEQEQPCVRFITTYSTDAIHVLRRNWHVLQANHKLRGREELSRVCPPNGT